MSQAPKAGWLGPELWELSAGGVGPVARDHQAVQGVVYLEEGFKVHYRGEIIGDREDNEFAEQGDADTEIGGC